MTTDLAILQSRVKGALKVLGIIDPTGITPLQWCRHEDQSLTDLPNIELDGKVHWLVQCNICKHVTVALNGR